MKLLQEIYKQDDGDNRKTPDDSFYWLEGGESAIQMYKNRHTQQTETSRASFQN